MQTRRRSGDCSTTSVMVASQDFSASGPDSNGEADELQGQGLRARPRVEAFPRTHRGDGQGRQPSMGADAGGGVRLAPAGDLGGRPSDPAQAGLTEGAAEPATRGDGSGSDGTAVESSHDAASAGAGWIDNFRLWGSSSWRQMTAI